MLEASHYVQTIERAQGYKIACLEEIAFNNKWITKSELIDLIKSYPNNALEEYFSFLNKMINIFQPSIPEESIKNLEKVFQSNWLGRGEYVQEFESNLCDYLNIKSESFHTVSSCSDAIFGAFKAFKFPAGSKVLIPTNSFPQYLQPF